MLRVIEKASQDAPHKVEKIVGGVSDPHRVCVALSSGPVHDDPFICAHVVLSFLLKHAQ